MWSSTCSLLCRGSRGATSSSTTCMGFAALTPLPLVRDVLAMAVCVRGEFLDDTFVSGYLPYVLGARVQHWRSLNARIIWKKPARVTWTYVSDFSLTPELTADELLAVAAKRDSCPRDR